MPIVRRPVEGEALIHQRENSVLSQNNDSNFVRFCCKHSLRSMLAVPARL